MRRMALGIDPGSTHTAAAIVAQDDSGPVVFVGKWYLPNHPPAFVDLVQDFSTPRPREPKTELYIAVERNYPNPKGGNSLLDTAEFAGFLAHLLHAHNPKRPTKKIWADKVAPGWLKKLTPAKRVRAIEDALREQIVDFPTFFKSNEHERDAIGLALYALMEA